MDCRRWREVISARLDGEATETESVAVDVHLEGCAGCRTAMERAERVARWVRAYAVEPGPGPAIVLGAPECACAAGCACGCQSGRPCRCGHAA